MMREPPFSLLPRPAPRALRGARLLVLGLGDTGLSVARFAAREGAAVRVADTREHPPCRDRFDGELHLGPFDEDQPATRRPRGAPVEQQREAAVARGGGRLLVKPAHQLATREALRGFDRVRRPVAHDARRRLTR